MSELEANFGEAKLNEAKLNEAKLSPDDLAAIDPAYWVRLRKIRLPEGIFSFARHEYQIDPMRSEARRKCYMKGTQGGFTLLEVLNTLHGMIHCRYPQGVLYMFPTNDDVGEFSKSRFSPLIDSNPTAIGRFVKTHGRGTDTTSLKKIGDGFLYLRGARLSQKIGVGDDEKESAKLRSIPVDKVVFDEMDLMDDAVIAKAVGRMGHSDLKEEVYISNPTIPGCGIDKLFQLSDQRHLFRKCGCGHWTCAELSFPNCVKFRDDGTGYIGCDKCGSEVGMTWRNIEWVPSVKDNTEYMEGWRWSQLSSPFNDPGEIYNEFCDPPHGNIADIYRLRLGLPYVSVEDKLRVSDVIECCGDRPMQAGHNGPCAMGVDVGKLKHVVIGTRTGTDQYELIKMVRVNDWNDIADLAKRFNVRSSVIDIRPYEDEARRFQKSQTYRTFLCEYTENAMIDNDFGANGIVKSYRTGICDSTARMVMQKRLRIPRQCPEVDEFALQVSSMAKVLETNKRTNTGVYRYRATGADHYRHALNYFYLAAAGGRIVSAGSSAGRRAEYAINNSVSI